MHHYTYVRATRSDVERKLRQSAKADKSGETIVPEWMEAVYDRLPHGENLHAFVKHRAKWPRVEKIWLDSFPDAMRHAKLLRHWLPNRMDPTGTFQTILDGEAAALFRLAKGKRRAVDLGTYHGFSAVVLSLACDWVHTVDCYEGSRAKEYRDFAPSAHVNHSLFQRFGNITMAARETVGAGHAWSDPVDVLFVDADHSEDETMNNVLAWRPHVVPGGRIIFHDCNEAHPGVMAAVQRVNQWGSLLRRIDPGEHAGSLAAFEVIA
jgi:hypothetical protein